MGVYTECPAKCGTSWLASETVPCPTCGAEPAEENGHGDGEEEQGRRQRQGREGLLAPNVAHEARGQLLGPDLVCSIAGDPRPGEFRPVLTIVTTGANISDLTVTIGDDDPFDYLRSL